MIVTRRTIKFDYCPICQGKIMWYQLKRVVGMSGSIFCSIADKVVYRHRKCNSNSVHVTDTPDVVMNVKILKKVWDLKDELPPDIYSKMCHLVAETNLEHDELMRLSYGT